MPSDSASKTYGTVSADEQKKSGPDWRPSRLAAMVLLAECRLAVRLPLPMPALCFLVSHR